MPARQAKDSGKEAPPRELATSNPPVYRGSVAGYDFFLQSICEIQKSVGQIESSISHLSDRVKVHEDKLDGIVKDVHGAKRIAWIFGILFSIVGSIGLVFLNKILDLVVAYYNAKLPTH
jgi:hypothetical protein